MNSQREWVPGRPQSNCETSTTAVISTGRGVDNEKTSEELTKHN